MATISVSERQGWTIVVLLCAILFALAMIGVRMDSILAVLQDKGTYGGPLQRIDHNVAIIGDYGIPAQEPNAPKVVR